jgi:hypothetical protein
VRAVASVAQLRCPGCETTLLVLPEVVASVLDVRTDALREALGGLDHKSGDRFTVADQDGFFLCPRCSMSGCATEART